MSYASKAGRARVSPSSPVSQAVCDRCGMWYSITDLVWQHDYRGPVLQNLRILVCKQTCLDVPQSQLKSIVLPADPVPTLNARVEPFFADEMTYMGLSGSTIDPTTGIPIPNTTGMSTVPGVPMTPEPIGRPDGLTQNATSPLQTVKGVVRHFGVKLPVLSVISNGTDQITVTCSAPHGLVTNDQISAEGLTNPLACGFYSVTVTTATAFTYQTYAESIPANSLLEPTTIIWTVLVELPPGYVQIPRVA